jgi:hypothetical protein
MGMKYIKEFLIENELEDLRRDLMGLGYERWEVSVNGTITIKKGSNRWMSYEVWSKGVGDTKESAMRYALQAIYKCVQEGEVIEGIRERWDGEISKELKDKGVMLIPAVSSKGIEGEVEWEFSPSTELVSYGNALPEFFGEYYKEDGKFYKR